MSGRSASRSLRTTSPSSPPHCGRILCPPSPGDGNGEEVVVDVAEVSPAESNRDGVNGWKDVHYPHLGGRTADEIPEWKDDPGWVVRYTHYAEALDLAAEARHYIDTYKDPENPESPATGLLEQLGDPTRAVWDGLDTSRRTQREQGLFLLDEVFVPVLDNLRHSRSTQPHLAVDDTLVAWFVAFNALSRPARKSLYEELSGETAPADINAWIRTVAWPKGLRELDRRNQTDGVERPSLRPEAIPGLRRITQLIDEHLQDERPAEIAFNFANPFERLLPLDIAKKLESRTESLKEYREQLLAQGLLVKGIDDRGFTDLWHQGLPILRKRLMERKSLLLIGPTTTGKTDFSRIAASHVICQKKKVIVLLPTKALVSQAAEEWRAFFASCPSSEKWRLLEASRDHPYNDEDISRGDYNVVLAIPEKLAAYLAGGSRILDQCGLLVVDELQTLNQKQRGANIESLLTIIRSEYPNLPIIGLSATLTRDSSRSLRAWLDVGSDPENGFIETSNRPVSLDRLASQPDKWRKRTLQGEVIDGAWDPSLSDPHLSNVIRQGLNRASHIDAALLACRLLLRDDSVNDQKGLLIFVGSRRAAEKIASALQAALETLLGDSSAWHSPHYGRFGRQVLSADEAEERDAEFFRLPDLPAKEDVREGLSTGVMYHNARLDPDQRRIVEHAFNDKVIRVLVATATLAVGMNLPADFVVVADITEGTSRFEDEQPVERLLDSHDIAQRFGRCGRLGKSIRGEAYVVVQRGQGRQRLLQLSDDQIEVFQDTTDTADAPSTATLTRSVDEHMASLENVFDYFVMSDDTGEPVHTNLDTKGFARLLLQDICRQAPAVTNADLEARIARIYQHSLLKVEGHKKPELFGLLDMLESEMLIGPAPEDQEKWKISGLGRTVALSNVPITNSRGIREVAEAASLGAGPLTLLTIAAQADYVRELTWLSLPHESTSDLVDQMRSKIWQVVRAFAAPRRANCRSFDSPDFLGVLRDTDLVGCGASAQSFRGRVDTDIHMFLDATIVAHFRACISILWLKGYPMNPLISFIQKNTQSTLNGRTRKVEAYPTDVRDLGERLSYVLNAAAEVLRVAPEDGRHLTLRNMSEALQSGIPYQLAPMLRLRGPRIHRERLVALLDMREDELDFDDLPGVLSTLSTPREGRSAPQERAHRNLAFTEDERSEILARMSRDRGKEGAKALPPELRDEKIPARRDIEGSISYGRIANDMARMVSLESRVGELVCVLQEFGLEVTSKTAGTEAVLRIRRNVTDEQVELFLLDHRLDKSVLQGAQASSRTLILMKGITAGAEYALRSTDVPGFSAMSIWVFLAGLARIDRSWRANYYGPDPDAELARRVLSFFGTSMGPISLADVSLAEVAAGLPTPPPLFAR